MYTQWIVVANASLARFFKRDSPNQPLIPLPTLQHPQSRMKGADLTDDRPGHEANDISAGGNRFQPRTDPRRKEHRHFAHEIAARLDEALMRNEFKSLVLLASDPFLGEVKSQLSDAVAARLQLTRNSDYTSLDAQAIEERLRELRSAARA